MPSDLSHMEKAGRACIGCGSETKPLQRIRSYSRALACADCYFKDANLRCAGKNPQGQPCNHEPHLRGRPCPHCGCEAYIHGLEGEHDRQLSIGVGKTRTYRECTGYGQNLGKCGRPVLLGPDGVLLRLCQDCDDNWKRETVQGAREMKEKFDQDAALLDGADMSKPQ